MNTTNTRRASRLRVAALCLGLVIATGCAKQPATDGAFKTPEEAVSALVAALQKDDVAGLQALLGPGSEELLDSGDAVQDASDDNRRGDESADILQPVALVHLGPAGG